MLGAQVAQVFAFEEFFHVLRLRGGKGVVRKSEFFFVLIPREKGKINYPGKRHRIGVLVRPPQIKFVGTEFLDGLLVGVNGEGFFPDFFSKRLSDENHQPLHHIQHVALGGK